VSLSGATFLSVIDELCCDCESGGNSKEKPKGEHEPEPLLKFTQHTAYKIAHFCWPKWMMYNFHFVAFLFLTHLMLSCSCGFLTVSLLFYPIAPVEIS
jgi:hypothetical protein